MSKKNLSEFSEGNLRAVVFFDSQHQSFGVDFFENHSIIKTEMYPNKSIFWSEDAAENWVFGFKKVVDGA